MAEEKHSPQGALLTQLVLELFRLNGRLLAAGDDLVVDIGLSSARWQVLGAIHFAPAAQSVSALARAMGLTRQAVQRIVNELKAEGIVHLKENPAHRRAPLVVLTRKGQSLYAAAERRQIPWINALGRGLDRECVTHALDLLRTLQARLD